MVPSGRNGAVLAEAVPAVHRLLIGGHCYRHRGGYILSLHTKIIAQIILRKEQLVALHRCRPWSCSSGLTDAGLRVEGAALPHRCRTWSCSSCLTSQIYTDCRDVAAALSHRYRLWSCSSCLTPQVDCRVVAAALPHRCRLWSCSSCHGSSFE